MPSPPACTSLAVLLLYSYLLSIRFPLIYSFVRLENNKEYEKKIYKKEKNFPCYGPRAHQLLPLVSFTSIHIPPLNMAPLHLILYGMKYLKDGR